MNSVAAFPVPLPDTSSAPLPQMYEAARAALAECEKIDECKTWSDKAAAIASYARQAKDDGLRVMAVRIQARAERRCGELLKQIPRADAATRYGQAAPVPPVTRTQAATDAGLSDRQRKTALRIAAVPEAAFEAQIESPRPPSITQLAGQGTVPRTWQAPMQRDQSETSPANEALAVLVRFCEGNEPTRLARASGGHEVVALRRAVGMVERWLRQFAEHLPAG